jgi:hypothetical protein
VSSETLLAELAEVNPLQRHEDGSACFFCGSEYEPHRADCLWLRVRQDRGLPLPPIDQDVNEDDEAYQRRKVIEADIAAYGPMAPRQDVPTAMQAAMSQMATLYNKQIYGLFNSKAVSIRGLSDAITGRDDET